MLPIVLAALGVLIFTTGAILLVRSRKTHVVGKTHVVNKLDLAEPTPAEVEPATTKQHAVVEAAVVTESATDIIRIDIDTEPVHHHHH